MFAVDQPGARCGHLAAVAQQCGRCLRWCCPDCYSPWTALACNACRAGAAEAGRPDSAPTRRGRRTDDRALARPRCRELLGRTRRRESDVDGLAERVAELERRLSEIHPAS